MTLTSWHPGISGAVLCISNFVLQEILLLAHLLGHALWFAFVTFSFRCSCRCTECSIASPPLQHRSGFWSPAGTSRIPHLLPGLLCLSQHGLRGHKRGGRGVKIFFLLFITVIPWHLWSIVLGWLSNVFSLRTNKANCLSPRKTRGRLIGALALVSWSPAV